MGTLLLGMGCWQMGQKGFHGTLETMDPESLVTPWLISCWLVAVLRGLGRSHALLRQVYGLDTLRSQEKAKGWEEVAGYFAAFGLEPKMDSHALWMDVVGRYSRSTGQFLFGTPSQYRRSVGP